jgi:hypothetical protein
MAGKSVLWLRSIPSTKADIRRSRLPIQKKNHSIRATFHTAWAINRHSAVPHSDELAALYLIVGASILIFGRRRR